MTCELNDKESALQRLGMILRGSTTGKGLEIRKTTCSLTAREEARGAAHRPGRTGGLLTDSRLCTVSTETVLLGVPFLNYLEKLLLRLAGCRVHGNLKKPP